MSPVSGLAAFPRLSEAEQLFRENKTEAASTVLIQHLREHRDEPRGLALLGHIAVDTGAFFQGERFLRRAIELGVSDFETRRKLASAMLKQDRLDEALDAFTQLEAERDDVDVIGTRASILDRLGRTDEALAQYDRVLTHPQADTRHWIMYGHSLRFAGRTEEAIAAFRKVASQDPERGGAWWGLADIKSRTLTDQDMEAMQAALGIAVDIQNLEPLHMALARGWHDRGEYERAFYHYREGNRLRAELIKYDPRELSADVEEFVAMTSQQQFGPPVDAPRPTPIFIVSLPRSGSTLLEQMLGAHPQIEATGELPYIRALMRTSLELHMTRGRLTVPQYVARLTGDEKQALGAEYMRLAALHRRTDAPYFADKMPSNWTDILFIRAILPQARFIEIRRNAMDCCFSNYTHHFGSAHAASFDLVHQARACADYTRLMDHLNAVAPDLLCSIRYETLIADPRAELGRAMDYLNLDWSEDMLRFHESERVVRTPSAEQVRRPLNRRGIGTWRPYAQWLRPLREALGPLADA